MIYRTIQLYDLVVHSEISKNDVMNILADFSCPLNDDVENFIRTKAYDFERTGLCRTYLVYAIDKDDSANLCGIYSLTPGAIELDNKLSNKDKKKLLGTTYPIGRNIKTYLIGQLSKNFKDGNDRFITGELLIELAFDRIRKNNITVPSTVIHIDCKDNPKLRNFYEKFGFIYFHMKDNLCVYLMPTSRLMNTEYKVKKRELVVD